MCPKAIGYCAYAHFRPKIQALAQSHRSMSLQVVVMHLPWRRSPTTRPLPRLRPTPASPLLAAHIPQEQLVVMLPLLLCRRRHVLHMRSILPSMLRALRYESLLHDDKTTVRHRYPVTITTIALKHLGHPDTPLWSALTL